MSPSLLVAGIGNIFFGDDAFGVEVVSRLATETMPAGVIVRDFGIRGFDLACELQAGYHTAILVDTVQRGSPPGTLHVLELDVPTGPIGNLEMHHLDPMQVLRLVQQMGGRLPRLFLVGCEPAALELDDEGAAMLSECVRLAVSKAVDLVKTLSREMQPNDGKSGRSSDA